MTPRAGPTVVSLDEVPVEVPVAPSADRRRLVLAAGVALLVVALVGVVVDPAVTGDPDLLGRLDDATGRSSLLPPADDLQLLWRRPGEAAPMHVQVPALRDLGGHVQVGNEVVDVEGGGTSVVWPADTVPSRTGEVAVVDGFDLVVADATSGAVLRRTPVRDGAGWAPAGGALGWVAGAAVLADPDGVLGAVGRDGRVRWTGDPSWRWDGTGHGTDWLVVEADGGGSVARLLVVDGSDGTVARDVGPAGSIHAPVVHGDTLAWVDPFAGVDRGLGHPVEVHAVRLDGTGRVWAVDDLPPTSGVPDAVRLTSTDDSVVVDYWTAGQSTTAVWLDPATGERRGTVTVGGTGLTPGGWPVTAVVEDGLAHVDPVRQEVRVVDRRGVIRWSMPARSGEGVVGDGDVLLVRTAEWQTQFLTSPPRGSLLQTRVRLVAASNGDLLWDRITDDSVEQRFVGTLAGSVGVAPAGSRLPLGEQTWYEPETGRRRSGTGLATREVGGAVPIGADVVLLGRVADGVEMRSLFLTADGRLLGLEGTATGTDLADLLAPAAGVRARGGSAVTLADGGLVVVVGTASLSAGAPDGDLRWEVDSSEVLRPDLAVLHDTHVVVATNDGRVWAFDRDDGSRSWAFDGARVTALTGAGDEVVVGTADGRVLVLDDRGEVLQDVRVGRLAVEDVVVVDGRVVAAVGAETIGLGRGSYVVEQRDRVEVP